MRLPFLACWLAALASAQSFTYRGFFESRNSLFPQEAPNDSGLAVAEGLLRSEFSWRPKKGIQVNFSLDARTDSHRQFEREFRLDALDRSDQRPAFSARRYSVLFTRGGLNFEFGRQFIRWGKTDILNPTDRFAPKDFLNVVNTEFLGVLAARLTYERDGNTIDAVYVPVFTPSRSPLLNQRWVVPPPAAAGVPFALGATDYPGRGQFGLRWNRVGGRAEYSLSFFDGFNHLPLFETRLDLTAGPRVLLDRYYARMRMAGGDFAMPLRWFTLKTEAAWFTSATQSADEYAQYVIQVERIQGEWTMVGGYAGEAVTKRRSPLDFAPDRGLTKSFLGRVSYNLDANRTVSFDGVVRQDGAGLLGRFEYSQAIGSHWRALASFTLLRGEPADFIGQYRRNSHFQLTARYNF